MVSKIMKQHFLLLSSLALLLLASCEKKTVESLTISVAPTEINVSCDGGTFDIAICSVKSWSVKSNQTWAVASPTEGSNNGAIKLTVSENSSKESDSAIVTVSTADGKSATVTINRKGNPDLCSADQYKQVTIGDQTWMAENYKCSKYDTESEAYKRGRYKVPYGYSYMTPYYVDGADKSMWSTEMTNAENLTDAQVAKFGYLYDWAAAVGVEYGKDNYYSTGNRQGICPNGWHIPTVEEFDELVKKLGGMSVAGKKLKTTSGWYDGGNGTDAYGFSGLPSGYCGGTVINYIGTYGEYHTATYHNTYNYYFTSAYLYYNYDYFYENEKSLKDFGYSVRCVKN